MFDSKSFEGFWWLPEEDRDVPGKLEFTPEHGIELDLWRPLDEQTIVGSGEEEDRYEMVHGITNNGQEVTVENLTRSGGSGIGPTRSETYNGITLFVGDHISKDTEFNRVSVMAEIIDRWANRSVTSQESSMLERAMESKGPVKGQIGDTTSISVEIPESLEAEIEQGVLQLKHKIGSTIQRTGGGEITDDCYFSFEFNNSVGEEELMEMVKDIKDFISFAMGENCWADEVTAQGSNISEVNIFYAPVGGYSSSINMHPYKTNFLLNDIHDNYEQVIKSWFSICEKYRESMNLYLSTRYNDQMYNNNSFFSMMQVIEVYHRRDNNFNGEYLSEERFEEIYDKLCGAIDGEDLPHDFEQHLVKGTFKYANEYSLRKRLKELISEVDHILAQIPLDFEKKANKQIKARNSLTHEGDAGVPVNELYEYELILKALFEVLILHELEINEEHIVERISRRYEERSDSASE